MKKYLNHQLFNSATKIINTTLLMQKGIDLYHLEIMKKNKINLYQTVFYP
jgi:hypothetical protein